MQEVSLLWKRFLEHRDKFSRDELVAAYLPFVRYIATGIVRKLRPGFDLEDLISDGVFGLMKAIDYFDPSRGAKFETYATPVVRGSIYNGLRKLDWVPERTRGKARALQKAMDKFTLIYGRPGTENELAEELKISATEVYELITDMGCIYLLSLDQPLSSSEDDETTILDTVEDSQMVDPSAEVEFAEQKKSLRDSLEQLSEREQLLIREHYFEGVPFEQIATRLGVTKQRISQMHARAVKKLRDTLSYKEQNFKPADSADGKDRPE
ncbi:MAG: FliA/WhiG family RNA polymerase sigma factor [bacterium]